MPPIPWFDLSGARYGPWSVFAWSGVLAAAVGGVVAACAARRAGLTARRSAPSLVFIGSCGALGAHLMAALAYAPAAEPALRLRLLLDLTNGAASTGGLLGGLVGACAAARLLRVPSPRLLDVSARAAAAGFVVGRAGCALVHDHPGRAWPWFPALDFPGGPRLDLGLLEWAVWLALAPWILRARGDGAAAARFLLGYGAVRFALDFLRVDAAEAAPLVARGWMKASDVDPRIAGLTPAQYACVALMAAGAIVLRGVLKKSPRPTR